MNRFLLIWIGVLLALGFLAFRLFSQLPDGRVHVYFLDIGQGDSTFIKTGKGQNVIIDSGPGTKILEALDKSGAMGYLDHTIDLLIVTHFQKDHAEGFLALMERYDVRRILITGALVKSSLETEFFKRAKDRNVPILFARSDRDFRLDDGLFLDVVFPFRPLVGHFFSDLNDSSLTTRLIYRGRPVLFDGGDMGFKLENFLMGSDANLRAENLKVSHHGSKGSSGLEFLKAVGAKTAVISLGKHNSYGHPHAETLSRLSSSGISVRRTDKEGTVEMVF